MAVLLKISTISLYSEEATSVPAADPEETLIKSPTEKSVVNEVPEPVIVSEPKNVSTVPEIAVSPLLEAPNSFT